MEDLPLGRIAALVHVFEVKDLPLGRTLMMMSNIKFVNNTNELCVVGQIHSLHILDGAPGIFSDLVRFVEMLKREWGAESNGKLPHLFIPSKTAT